MFCMLERYLKIRDHLSNLDIEEIHDLLLKIKEDQAVGTLLLTLK